ncbi:MAG: sulfatase [Bacteroidetes bacterium]|nr:sulfatase [Bacteroidota bacterium]MBS1930164.1 sulfatase [Bacteroidota bacterium]
MKIARLIIFLYLIFSTLSTSAQRRPNILIIISDDHAYQAISAYGNKIIATPNIDRIAKEGAIFKRAYVTNSLCGPSRATIITGKYSNKNGFTDNEHSSFDGSQNTFIKELTKSGYQTAWIGKWHLETIPQGFTYWEILPGQGSYYNPDFIMMDSSKKRVEGYVTNIIEDKAEDWLNKRDTSKPFCLIIGHKATHRTWIPDLTDMGRYDNINFPLPKNFYDDYAGRKAASMQDMTISKTLIIGYDLKMFDSEESENKDGNINRMNAAQRAKFDSHYKPIYKDFISQKLTGHALTVWKYQHYMRDYLSTAASLDRNIGRILDYLDQHHLTGNTIVIYLSDQGFYLGEHGWFDKRWMYEESFRTPMVMRYPGLIKPGTVNKNFVLNLDIAPTMLDAAGVKIPADMQGQSFLPLLQARYASGRDAMYYHYYENGEHDVSPHFGIRTKRYKLIRFYQRVDNWELYDLQKDPLEMKNLYGEKGYKKITEQLKMQLNDLIKKYDDTDAGKILKQIK